MWPQHQVPVVGHEAVGEDEDAGDGLLHLGEEGDEGVVVAGGVEEPLAAVAAVEHVVDDAADGLAGAAGHEAEGKPEGAKAARKM